MSEIHHECGIVAIYHLPGEGDSPLCTDHGPGEISRLLPRMLQDIQNRGQLAAGFTTYSPDRNQLIVDLQKDITVGGRWVVHKTHRNQRVRSELVAIKTEETALEQIMPILILAVDPPGIIKQ